MRLEVNAGLNRNVLELMSFERGWQKITRDEVLLVHRNRRCEELHGRNICAKFAVVCGLCSKRGFMLSTVNRQKHTQHKAPWHYSKFIISKDFVEYCVIE